MATSKKNKMSAATKAKLASYRKPAKAPLAGAAKAAFLAKMAKGRKAAGKNPPGRAMKNPPGGSINGKGITFAEWVAAAGFRITTATDDGAATQAHAAAWQAGEDPTAWRASGAVGRLDRAAQARAKAGRTAAKLAKMRARGAEPVGDPLADVNGYVSGYKVTGPRTWLREDVFVQRSTLPGKPWLLFVGKIDKIAGAEAFWVSAYKTKGEILSKWKQNPLSPGDAWRAAQVEADRSSEALVSYNAASAVRAKAAGVKARAEVVRRHKAANRAANIANNAAENRRASKANPPGSGAFKVMLGAEQVDAFKTEAVALRMLAEYRAAYPKGSKLRIVHAKRATTAKKNPPGPKVSLVVLKREGGGISWVAYTGAARLVVRQGHCASKPDAAILALFRKRYPGAQVGFGG